MDGEMHIELRKVRLFGYHGLYPEEKKTGGEFEINLSVSFFPAKKIGSLNDSINYELLFDLLKDEMQKPRELLETLTMDITEKIHEKFMTAKKIKIEIIKLNPPIPGLTGSVAAIYSKEF